MDAGTDELALAVANVDKKDEGDDEEKQQDSDTDEEDSFYYKKIMTHFNTVTAVTESELALSNKSGSSVGWSKNVAMLSSSSSPIQSGSSSESTPLLSTSDGMVAPSPSRVGARSARSARATRRKSMSEETIKSGGDPQKEYLENKKTQSMNYMTVRILTQQQQQKLAALHCDAIHDYCFFFPSVLITLLSGILAILAKSTLVPNDRTETLIALVIAIFAILSTLLQSLMKQFDFSGRAGFHSSCATALRKLYLYSKLDAREATYNNIHQSLTAKSKPVSVRAKLTEEEEHHDSESEEVDRSTGPKDNATESDTKSSQKSPAKEENDAATEEAEKEEEDYMDKEDTQTPEVSSNISAQFRQAVESCDSVVPIAISSAFAILRARLELVNKSTMIHKVHAKVDFSIVLPSLIYQLSNTILMYKHFPLRLPDPEWAVEKTLRDWKQHLKSDADNSADLLSDLIGRSQMIRHLGEKEPLLPK